MSIISRSYNDLNGKFSYLDGDSLIPIDFENKNLANFWEKYCKNSSENMYENNRIFMPVVFRIKIDFDEDIEDEDFDEFIVEFIKVTNNVISSENDIDNIYLCTCVLDNRVGKTFYCRIQYPHLMLNISKQIKMLDKIFKECRKNKIKDHLSCEPIGSWKDFVPTNLLKSPLALYGSKEDEKSPILNLYSFYNEDVDVMEPDEVFDATNHKICRDGLLGKGKIERKEALYWLPLILSIDFCEPTNDNDEDDSLEMRFLHPYDDSVELSKLFLDMIDKNARKHDIYWLEIGKALYNITDGNDEGLMLWKNFSDDERCEDKYPDLDTKNNITIRTLAWYAREDDPTRYEQWNTLWSRSVLENEDNLGDQHLAYLLYTMKWLDIICQPVGKGAIWYIFKQHTLLKLPSQVFMDACVFDEKHPRRTNLYKFVANEISYYADLAKNENDMNTTQKYYEKIKILQRCSNRISGDRGPGSIIHSSIKYFSDETDDGAYISFFEKVNVRDALGCKNGVIEFYKNDAIYRSGKLEDFITQVTRSKYPVNCNWDHPKIKLLEKEVLDKLFPNPEIKDFYGRIGGSSLSTECFEKKVIFNTGKTNGGKSAAKGLSESALGSYANNLSSKFFASGGSGSGGPSPEEARLGYSRQVWSQEPSARITIDDGKFKESSGGDTKFARFLNENGGDVEFNYTLYINCNLIPSFAHVDSAVKARVLPLPFEAKFDNDAPDDPEEQTRLKHFKCNPNMKKMLNDLGPYYLWYLCRMFEEYKRVGLKIPEVILKNTREHWRNRDPYDCFLAEKVEEDEEGDVSLGEMYFSFKNWWMHNQQGITPDRDIFKHSTNERIGSCDFENIWHGYSMKKMRDEDDMDDPLNRG